MADAELEMIAEQFSAMLVAMRRAKKQIEAQDPANPFVSQALGSALAAVATLMLEELDGWARLLRAKVPEACGFCRRREPSCLRMTRIRPTCLP